MADHRATWVRLRKVARQEAAESAAEQRALMASFETQRRDEATWRLMAAERRAGRRTKARANRHISVTWRLMS
jgi:hypothetical protein